MGTLRKIQRGGVLRRIDTGEIVASGPGGAMEQPVRTARQELMERERAGRRLEILARSQTGLREAAERGARRQEALARSQAGLPQKKVEQVRHVEAGGDPTALERVGYTASGAAKGYAGDMMGTLGTIQQVTGGTFRRNYTTVDLQQRQKELDRALYEIRYAGDEAERTYWALEAEKARRDIAHYETALKETETAGADALRLADRLTDSGARDIERAKKGLGAAGRFLVDVGAAGGQMAGDAGLALLTGGSALAPMAVQRGPRRAPRGGERRSKGAGAVFGEAGNGA